MNSLPQLGTYVYMEGSRRKAVMLTITTTSIFMFVTSLWLVANDAVWGHGHGVQASKRTPIRAGGLSTVGGNLPE
jgi:type IV secretory pathway TrbD component